MLFNHTCIPEHQMDKVQTSCHTAAYCLCSQAQNLLVFPCTELFPSVPPRLWSRLPLQLCLSDSVESSSHGLHLCFLSSFFKTWFSVDILIVSGTLCVFCLWKVVYKYFSYSLTSGFYHVWSVFLFLLAKAISTFTAYHIISFWVYSVWKVLVADLQTTLSLRVLFIHDPLLLCSLLLLPPCLGCLLTLSVSLLQEVLFHTGTVFISFLFALNIQEWLKKKLKH